MALITTETEDTGSRVVSWMRDEETGRSFELSHYYAAANGKPSDISVMASGKTGTWTASEMKPNGRLFAPDDKQFEDIPDKQWHRARKKPSTAFAAIRRFQKHHEGWQPVLCGGGRSSNTIYHPTQDAATSSILVAIASDTWVIDCEPVREFTLFPRCFITLNAKDTLDKAPGEEQIMAAIYSIRAKLKKSEILRVADHIDSLRLDVTNPNLAYPDDCRFTVFFTLAGVCELKGFARAGWYDLGDQLTGITIPRFDDPLYGSRGGFPAYGQLFTPPPPAIPEGFVIYGLKRSTKDGSDKIYAHVSYKNRDFVVWGKTSVGKLRSKATTGSDAADRFCGRGYEYGHFNWRDVPDFWNRVSSACKEVAGDVFKS